MDSIPGLELFNAYEQEFNDLVISIRNALNVEAKNLVGGRLHFQKICPLSLSLLF